MNTLRFLTIFLSGLLLTAAFLPVGAVTDENDSATVPLTVYWYLSGDSESQDRLVGSQEILGERGTSKEIYVFDFSETFHYAEGFNSRNFEWSAYEADDLKAGSQNGTLNVTFGEQAEIAFYLREFTAAVPLLEGEWTANWYRVTQRLNTSAEPATMEDTVMLADTVVLTTNESNIIQVSANDYTANAQLNRDPNHPWTFVPNYNGTGADENVTIDVTLPGNENGGTVNFYFTPPDWENIYNASAETVDETGAVVYTSRGWFEVMAKNDVLRPNPVNNSNLTYIRLGADINQRDDQNNGTFFVYRAKSSLVIDGAKDPDNPGAPEECYKFVQWFHPSPYGGGYTGQMIFGSNDGLGAAGIAAAPLTSFLWKNTFIIGGNGYGVIATDLDHITHSYENILYVGPQFDYNLQGRLTLHDVQIIIDDPRYMGNNIINYEDVNKIPYQLTLNLASQLYPNGTINNTRNYPYCYWGEVSEMTNVTFSGHSRIYRANGASAFIDTGIFQPSNVTSNTISIDPDSTVEIRHEHVAYGPDRLTYETPFVRAVYLYNLTVGDRAHFVYAGDHRFTSLVPDYATTFRIGDDAVVNLSSTYATKGNYLRFSNGLIFGNNSTLNILMENTEPTSFPVLDFNNSNLFLTNGSTLNVTGRYSVLSSTAMVNLSNTILEPGSEMRIINNGGGSVFQTGALRADEFSVLEVLGIGLNIDLFPAASVTSLDMDRVYNAVFYHGGGGPALQIRGLLPNNLLLTNMEEIKHWRLPNNAVFNPDTGNVNVEPTYNWTQRPNPIEGFNISASVILNGTINNTSFEVTDFHGNETLNNITFGLMEQVGSTAYNKNLLIYEGYVDPYPVTLNWNDPNNTVNSGEVCYRNTVAQDLDLQALEPPYPYYNFVGWYSDAELTTPYDVYVEEVSGPLELYGSWAPDGTVFSVTYENVAPTEHTNPASFKVTDVPIILTPASREGYAFSGWYTDDRYRSLVTQLVNLQNYTLHAKWGNTGTDPIVYNIAYNGLDADDSNSNPSAFTVEDLPVNLLPASRDGYAFEGWYDAASGGTLVTEINTSANQELWAFFDPNPIVYHITYNGLDSDDTNSNPTTFTVEDLPIGLAEAQRAGYGFTGWYDAASGGNLVTEINSSGDQELWAVFDSAPIQYNITYNGLEIGDTNSNPPTFTVEDLPVDLDDAVREGYTFTGWYDAPANGNRVTQIDSAGETELWAVFERIEYTIAYNGILPEHSNPNPTTFTIDMLPFSLLPASSDQSYFAGWFENDQYQTMIEEINESRNYVLYARWEAEELIFSVTYRNVSETEHSNPSSFVVSDLPIELMHASRDGYTFDGWREEDSQTVMTQLTSPRNYILDAEWTEITNPNRPGGSGGTGTGTVVPPKPQTLLTPPVTVPPEMPLPDPDPSDPLTPGEEPASNYAVTATLIFLGIVGGFLLFWSFKKE